jgi:hypothetical protein
MRRILQGKYAYYLKENVMQHALVAGASKKLAMPFM